MHMNTNIFKMRTYNKNLFISLIHIDLTFRMSPCPRKKKMHQMLQNFLYRLQIKFKFFYSLESGQRLHSKMKRKKYKNCILVLYKQLVSLLLLLLSSATPISCSQTKLDYFTVLFGFCSKFHEWLMKTTNYSLLLL